MEENPTITNKGRNKDKKETIFIRGDSFYKRITTQQNTIDEDSFNQQTTLKSEIQSPTPKQQKLQQQNILTSNHDGSNNADAQLSEQTRKLPELFVNIKKLSANIVKNQHVQEIDINDIYPEKQKIYEIYFPYNNFIKVLADYDQLRRKSEQYKKLIRRQKESKQVYQSSFHKNTKKVSNFGLQTQKKNNGSIFHQDQKIYN